MPYGRDIGLLKRQKQVRRQRNPTWILCMKTKKAYVAKHGIERECGVFIAKSEPFSISITHWLSAPLRGHADKNNENPPLKTSFSASSSDTRNRIIFLASERYMTTKISVLIIIPRFCLILQNYFDIINGRCFSDSKKTSPSNIKYRIIKSIIIFKGCTKSHFEKDWYHISCILFKLILFEV